MSQFSFKKSRVASLTALAFLTAGLLFSASAVHEGHHGGGPNGQPNNQAMVAMSNTPCVAGMAGPFPCRNINLAAFLPTSDIGGGTVNDLWGWTDSSTGKEYALVGRSSGTAFVDISDPYRPVYLGDLPAHRIDPAVSNDSLWRGIKAYANHAFIVSEAANHGMQVFNLARLRNIAAPPVTFTEDAHYSGFLRAHTIAVNEETGFAYAAGSQGAGVTCEGGLHMVDIRNPVAPVFAGCVGQDGYTHETQCVSYHGPDLAYLGREICFSSNADTLTIVDVTNKSAPVQLSRTTYEGVGYTHQGWLTENHGYFLLDDEFDEIRAPFPNSSTYIWNVADLDAPTMTGVYEGPSTAIDHNQYIRGNRAYQSNYRSGLRILDISNIGAASLNEVAFFDIYSVDDLPQFNGAWSNYPFFPSGIVIVGGIEQGLFVLAPTRTGPPVLLTEPNSERALALHSVSFERDPFSLTTERNLLSTDKQTRITLLANNIDSFPGEDLSTLTAQIEDPQGTPAALEVESVRKVPNEGLTQVVVKLPLQIASAGDFRVSISLAGTVSNKAIVRLKP